MGCIAIFTSIGTFTILNKRKEPQGDLLTQEEGKQLATRIKRTEQELKKLDNKILAQSQEFNNIDNKRRHKQNQIHDTLKLINTRLQEKGKGKITKEQVQEKINNLDDGFQELEEIEQEIIKLKSKDKYTMKI